MTADWVVPEPFNSQAFNRYSYVLNNPINLIDPSGNSSMLSAMLLDDFQLDQVGYSNTLSGNYSWLSSNYGLEGEIASYNLNNADFGGNNHSFNFTDSLKSNIGLSS